MQIKPKYRTIVISGKRLVETDWEEKFLVDDDFNDKDFDWDTFFDVKPKTYQNDGRGEDNIPTTYSLKITSVVEGEEYSEASSHDFSSSPHKLMRNTGEVYFTRNERDDKDCWTKRIIGLEKIEEPVF